MRKRENTRRELNTVIGFGILPGHSLTPIPICILPGAMIHPG